MNTPDAQAAGEHGAGNQDSKLIAKLQNHVVVVREEIFLPWGHHPLRLSCASNAGHI